jgi:hypothetical protein
VRSCVQIDVRDPVFGEPPQPLLELSRSKRGAHAAQYREARPREKQADQDELLLAQRRIFDRSRSMVLRQIVDPPAQTLRQPARAAGERNGSSRPEHTLEAHLPGCSSPLPMYGSPRHIHGSAVSLPTNVWLVATRSRPAFSRPYQGTPWRDPGVFDSMRW